MLAEPLEPELARRASWRQGLPALDVGHVVIGAPSTWLDVVTEVRDRVGSRRVIITNKGSIALTPAGCNKGTGLRAAIADLRRHELPILAIGDAINDLAMFAIADDRCRCR